MENQIIKGDCLEVMKGIEDNSVDLILTDPPYGIGFMGKEWDTFQQDYIKEQTESHYNQSRTALNREVKANRKYYQDINSPATRAGQYDNSKKGCLLFQEFIYKTSLACLRILKPGAFMFITMSPRQDRLSRAMIAIEDAGFNTGFTSIYWTYASGFPKAGNIGKMVDKRNGRNSNIYSLLADYLKVNREKKGLSQKDIAKLFLSKTGGLTGCVWNWENGENVPTQSQWKILKKKLDLDNRFDELIKREEAEREIIGKKKWNNSTHHFLPTANHRERIQLNDTKPTTPQAKALNGSYAGFQPKPAVEVILVAMKPLSEKTYVDQALKNGKGITWLDDVRIPYKEKLSFSNKGKTFHGQDYDKDKANMQQNNNGRFPANLLVSDDRLNDGRIRKSEGGKTLRKTKRNATNLGELPFQMQGYGDSGSFSRYFSLDKWFAKQLKKLPIGVQKTFPFLIVPKASKGEKNRGLEGLKEKQVEGANNNKYLGVDSAGNRKLMTKNNHPTVKPLKLMSYLITLGSREGDLVLDPFVGSGTTCIACKQLNRKFIGIDNNAEYVKITKARLAAVQPNLFASVGG